MKQYGVVISTDGNTAAVRVKRESACEGCASAGLCSSLCPNVTDTTAHNHAGAVVGDTVELETDSGAVLVYSALTFIMPIVLGLVGYFIAAGMGLGEVFAFAVLAFAVVLSFAMLRLIVKLRGKRDLAVKITKITRNSDDPEN